MLAQSEAHDAKELYLDSEFGPNINLNQFECELPFPLIAVALIDRDVILGCWTLRPAIS